MNKLRMDITKNKAMTLAEVLITLAIIGIVAAMAIPGLISKTGQSELNAKLKKVYAGLSAATNTLKMNNGGTLLDLFQSHNDLRDKYASILNWQKKCDSADVQGKCWHIHDGTGHWKRYIGANVGIGYNLETGLVLSDNIFLNFVHLSSDCTAGNFLNSNIGCSWIIADVNGFKNPNVIGKDIYYFYILKDKLIPWGTKESAMSDYCNGDGLYCAAKRLAGWEE